MNISIYTHAFYEHTPTAHQGCDKLGLELAARLGQGWRPKLARARSANWANLGVRLASKTGSVLGLACPNFHNSWLPC